LNLSSGKVHVAAITRSFIKTLLQIPLTEMHLKRMHRNFAF